MRDKSKKLLYIAGTLLLMALISLEYAACTWQIEGAAMLREPRGIVFAGGTIVFALAAAAVFGFYLRAMVKKKDR